MFRKFNLVFLTSNQFAKLLFSLFVFQLLKVSIVIDNYRLRDNFAARRTMVADHRCEKFLR